MNEYELPLVCFTVLCQWAAGSVLALTVLFVLRPEQLENAEHSKRLPSLAVLILLLNIAGSVFSLAHLGSPKEVLGSFSGFAHSWLSREGVAVIGLNILMLLWIFVIFRQRNNHKLVKGMSGITAAVGLCTVLISAQVYYQMMAHPVWHTLATHISFLATSVLLGFTTICVYLGLNDKKPETIPNVLTAGASFGAFLMLLVLFFYGSALQLSGGFMESAIIIFSSKLFVWQMLAGVLAVFMFTFYLHKADSVSKCLVYVILPIVASGVFSGRMLFYGSVLQVSPW